MSAEEHKAIDTFVIDKWWHRLLRVVMYGSTCLVFFTFAILSKDNSDHYTISYYYSFEPDYERVEGDEHTCSYNLHRQSLYCGELSSLDDLYARHHSAKHPPSSDLNPKGKSTASKAEPKLEEDFQAYRALRENEIRFRQVKRWKIESVARSVGITLGFTAAWFLFTFMVYKVILFIAYGHTRVRKA